jgi:multiple sugar transport system substrate-binding protein
MLTKRRLGLVACAALMPLTLTACVGGGVSSGGQGAEGDIRYAMWNSDQLPAYQECATAFEQKNPKIKIKIEQTGYDDYWNKLTNSLVAGTAPDAFADHVSKYPELANKKQLEPLNQYFERDKVDVGQYLPQLAEMWVGPEGSRYGLPKDWDTVALFYNKKLIRDAGLPEQDLGNLNWNPADGGSYEKAIAHLTVDEKGVRGDQPGFDKNHVKVYGLGLDGPDDPAGAGDGQTQWSFYAAAAGWQHTDKNPWGKHYNYDDPRFQDTIRWWRGLIEKGYAPPIEQVKSGIGPDEQFGAGRYAMVIQGSWSATKMFQKKGAEPAVAPTPIGPSGKRASMFNGLADSIWVGSQKKEAAWQWVKFLGSPECQNIVGKHAVVLPAIPQSLEIAKAKFAEQGIDLRPFTVHVEQGTTFKFPITDHASDISKIMKPAMESVMLGKAPVESLRDANAQVNQLFQK